MRGTYKSYAGYLPLVLSIVVRIFVSSVGHSYPYPGRLEVLYKIHTCVRNFWKFCTPVVTIPAERAIQHDFYPRRTSGIYLRLWESTRFFFLFCKASILLPGPCVTPVRLWHVAQYPWYERKRFLQYPVSPGFAHAQSEECILHFDVMFRQPHKPNNECRYVSFNNSS